jgi:hypothetical protein
MPVAENFLACDENVYEVLPHKDYPGGHIRGM